MLGRMLHPSNVAKKFSARGLFHDSGNDWTKIHILDGCLRSLCITLARLWRSDRDGLQGVFLRPIAGLLARKTTQQTARARLTTDRRDLCRGSLRFSHRSHQRLETDCILCAQGHGILSG